MLKLARSSVNIVKSISSRSIALSTVVGNAEPETKTVEQSKNDEPIEIPNPFEKEKRKCILCEMNVTPNYKNVRLLAQFQSPYTGRIYGRHITGLCKIKQEQVEKAIGRAQKCAMMPTYHKDLEYIKDPQLFNPEKPIRPHKY